MYLMDDFRSQLSSVIDAMLAHGGQPLFVVAWLEGAEQMRAAHGADSLAKFKEAAIDAVVSATSGADTFTYGDEKIVVILDGAAYDRLKTFALIQRLRRAIPLLGQSFDCYLRPEFDVLEYDAQVGVGGLIAALAARPQRDDHASAA